MTRHLLRRILVLFAVCAFALGAAVMAQDRKPREKPETVESPPAAQPNSGETTGGSDETKPGRDTPTDKKAKDEPEAKGETDAPKPGKAGSGAAPPAKEAEPDGKDAKNQKTDKEQKIDKESVEAVTEMSQRLAELQNFSVKAEMVWEQVLENGEKIMSVEQVQADVVRPRGLRLERSSPGRERILFYNGDEAVMWGPQTRYYTKIPFDGKIAALAKHLADKYAYELPLADLFLWGREKGDIEAIKAANFVGQDRIGERICDHYAFRQENVDWQIWIDTAEGGLPCRYAIIDLTDPARPVFQATVDIERDVDFFDERFTFDPPKDAAEIPIAEAGERAADMFEKKDGKEADEKAGGTAAEGPDAEPGKKDEKPDKKGDETPDKNAEEEQE